MRLELPGRRTSARRRARSLGGGGRTIGGCRHGLEYAERVHQLLGGTRPLDARRDLTVASGAGDHEALGHGLGIAGVAFAFQDGGRVSAWARMVANVAA